MNLKFWIILISYLMLYMSLMYYLFMPKETRLQKITASDGMECYIYGPAIDCNKQKFNYDTGYGEFEYSRDFEPIQEIEISEGIGP